MFCLSYLDRIKAHTYVLNQVRLSIPFPEVAYEVNYQLTQ